MRREIFWLVWLLLLVGPLFLPATPVAWGATLILSANFDADTKNAPPDLSLPGPPPGDFLVLGESSGTVLVREAVGTLVNQPIEMNQVPGIGGLAVSAFVSGGENSNSLVVSWRSLARSNNIFFLGCSLRSGSGLILAGVEYRPNGVLTHTRVGLVGPALPVSYTPDVDQLFEFTVDMVAQTTSLSVGGVALVGFQNVPFAQAGSGLAIVSFKGGGTFSQDFAIDDITVVTGMPEAGFPTWTPTGSMSQSRRGHIATPLADGNVLIVGGASTGLASAAELYNPAAGTFSPTGNMVTTSSTLQIFTATLLTNGMVLVVGGYNGTTTLNSAELYDPSTGEFAITGSMLQARNAHTATLLSDGRVLIVGGNDSIGGDTLSSAEIYDPATGAFSPTGSLTTDRAAHTATLLPNGQVLIAGGFQSTGPGTGKGLFSAELYDLAAGTFTVTGNMTVRQSGNNPRLLPSGEVLFIDGFSTRAELYDPSTGTFIATGSRTFATRHATATLLIEGKVLIAGGFVQGGPVLNNADLYDPVTETFTSTAGMIAARWEHTATLLSDGKVLVTGGSLGGGGDELSSAEIFLSNGPPVVAVAIDIKPGSLPNSINLKSKGVIPVAILTTEELDATTVDPGSVRFGPGEATEKHGVGHIEDVDSDGDGDVVYHFPTQDSGIQCGDTTATLTGETFGGQPVMGSDSIVTRCCK